MADAEPGARSTKHGAWAIPRKALDRSCRPQDSMFSANPESEGTDPALPFLVGEQSLKASSRASQECCSGSLLFQGIPTFPGVPTVLIGPYFSGTSLLLSRVPRQNSISPAGSFREGVGIVTVTAGQASATANNCLGVVNRTGTWQPVPGKTYTRIDFHWVKLHVSGFKPDALGPYPGMFYPGKAGWSWGPMDSAGIGARGCRVEDECLKLCPMSDQARWNLKRETRGGLE